MRVLAWNYKNHCGLKGYEGVVFEPCGIQIVAIAWTCAIVQAVIQIGVCTRYVSWTDPCAFATILTLLFFVSAVNQVPS